MKQTAKVLRVVLILQVLLIQITYSTTRTVQFDSQTQFTSEMETLNADAAKGDIRQLVLQKQESSTDSDPVNSLDPIESINTMPLLTSLSLQFEGAQITSLEKIGVALQNLANLTTLNLNFKANGLTSFSSISAIFAHADTTFKISTLTINIQNNNVADFSGFEEVFNRLTELVNLSILYSKTDDSVLDLSQLANTFDQLTKLQSLTLDFENCQGLSSIGFMTTSFEIAKQFTQTVLKFGQSAVTDLVPLAKLCHLSPGLTSLDLQFQELPGIPAEEIKRTNLTQIDCLQNIATLNTLNLDLHYCDQTVNFTTQQFIAIQEQACTVAGCNTGSCNQCRGTDTSCISCNANTFLKDNGCINEAACRAFTGPSFGPNPDTLVCEQCSDNCIACNSGKICTSCTATTHFLKAGNGSEATCVDANGCGDRFFSNTVNSLCDPCDHAVSKCGRCVETATKCLSCEPPAEGQQTLYFNPLDNTCGTTCPAGHWFKSGDENECLPDAECPSYGDGANFVNNQQCESCDEKCASCVTSADNCQSCKAPNKFNQETSKCLEKCPAGKYANNLDTCVPCEVENCIDCVQSYPPQCNKCSGDLLVYNEFARPSLCKDACDEGQFIKEKVCVEECGQGYFEKNMTKPDNSTYIECVKCSDNCNVCESETVCTTCQYDFYLTKEKACTDACPEGQFGSRYSYHCEDCGENCKKCGHQDICDVCYDQFKFNDGKCVSECESGQFLNDSNQCKRCSYKCLQCQGSEEHCTQCQENEEILIDNKCEICDVSCLKCRGTSEKDCETCKMGMYLQDGGECVFICKQGFKRDTPSMTCVEGEETEIDDGEEPDFMDQFNNQPQNLGAQKQEETSGHILALYLIVYIGFILYI